MIRKNGPVFWRSGLFLFLLLLLAPLQHVAAQEATTLSRMAVQMWPDFDDPSLLVLITAELPATTPVPQTVTLPIPSDARINAVARIDPSGAMFDDLAYDVVDGTITVTTTERAFRVEYYAPYAEAGGERSVRYAAPTDITIDSFELRVQRPAGASTMSVEPAGAELSTDTAGLSYYTFAPRPLAPGDSFVVSATYVMSENVLTVDRMAPPAQPQPVIPPAGGAAAVAPDDETDWLIFIIAGVGLSVSFLFLGMGIRDMRRGKGRSRPDKPRPHRAEKPRRGAAPPPPADAPPAGDAPRFCTSCGTPVSGAGDRFCRSCGTPIKGR